MARFRTRVVLVLLLLTALAGCKNPFSFWSSNDKDKDKSAQLAGGPTAPPGKSGYPTPPSQQATPTTTAPPSRFGGSASGIAGQAAPKDPFVAGQRGRYDAGSPSGRTGTVGGIAPGSGSVADTASLNNSPSRSSAGSSSPYGGAGSRFPTANADRVTNDRLGATSPSTSGSPGGYTGAPPANNPGVNSGYSGSGYPPSTNNYGPPTNYTTPNNYGPPTNYTTPNNYSPSTNYTPPNNYSPSTNYAAPNNYSQSNGYAPPPGNPASGVRPGTGSGANGAGSPAYASGAPAYGGGSVYGSGSRFDGGAATAPPANSGARVANPYVNDPGARRNTYSDVNAAADPRSSGGRAPVDNYAPSGAAGGADAYRSTNPADSGYRSSGAASGGSYPTSSNTPPASRDDGDSFRPGSTRSVARSPQYDDANSAGTAAQPGYYQQPASYTR